MNRFRAFVTFAVGSILVLCLLSADAGAQSRKKKKSRHKPKPAAAPVITNPSIAPPTTAEAATSGDIKVVSTADQTLGDTDTNSDSPAPKKPKLSQSPSDQQEMQQTINSLSKQVNRLNDRLSKMQDDDRYLIDMERLTRSEQRAEQLRSQLIDTQSKIADLQSRMDQLDYLLKPENLDKTTQLTGTVHPEEARDARRKQLENEKARVQAQLDILEKSRVRLESAITTADNEVDLLRARLNQQRDQQNTPGTSESRPRKPDQPDQPDQ